MLGGNCQQLGFFAQFPPIAAENEGCMQDGALCPGGMRPPMSLCMLFQHMFDVRVSFGKMSN